MKIAENVTQLIGHTPLMELKNIEKELKLSCRIAVKLESFNPAGSAKDRIAISMIEDARERGVLCPGATIIEPTSGNTGIGLACAAAALGYNLVIVMPDSMSIERVKLMEAYGAKVVLTKGSEGMSGAIKRADELAEEIPGSFIAGQFTNPANPSAHFKTTGPEIWEDTDGQVDIFVAGIGTGGTITGVGKYLKSKRPDTYIIGVEPDGSPVLSGGEAGPHGLQGIGAGFVPDVLDTQIYDEIITVTDEQAYTMCRMMAVREGILTGITSGAAVAAAVGAAQREENEGKLIVALLPDTGERYMSNGLFDLRG